MLVVWVVTLGGGGGGGDLHPLVTLGVVVVARGLLPRPVGVGHGVRSEVGVTQIVETIEPGEVRVAGHPETDHHQLGLPPGPVCSGCLANLVFNDTPYLCICDGCLYLECDLLYRAIFL